MALRPDTASDCVRTLRPVRETSCGPTHGQQVGPYPVVDVVHALERMVGNAILLAAVRQLRAGKEQVGGLSGGPVAHAVAGVGHAPAMGLQGPDRTGLPASARIVAGTFVGGTQAQLSRSERTSGWTGRAGRRTQRGRAWA